VSLRAGLEQWARRTGVRLVLLDDGSSPERAAAAHAELVERGCRIVLGPYGSDCVRAVAKTGALVWNHGGAADDVQRLPGVVSVPTPASRYLVALGRAVAELRPGAKVAVLAAPGDFARLAREGFEREAASLGLGHVPDPDEADAVFLCGPVEWERERFDRLAGRGVLLGGVSPGLASVPGSAAWPNGTLAPAQWHPDVRVKAEIGPNSVPLEDYVAAQAYAAVLIAEHCLELDPDDPHAAARALRTTTFFGAFELDETGLQRGHRLPVVRWQDGRRELFLAEAA